MNKFFLENIFNIFFPIKCGYCDEITENGSYICDSCRKELDLEDKLNRCKFCGTKLFDKNRVCLECDKDKKYYEELIFFSEYKDVLKNKILAYKFNDKKYLKDFFAEELSRYLLNLEADYIIGVPISTKRMRERGYNQTNLVAKKLGQILNIKYVSDILIKTGDTVHQSGLSKTERKINIKNSFKVADKYDICDKKILLIDDIFTTGATVNECSKMLKKAGAKKVIVATILRKD